MKPKNYYLSIVFKVVYSLIILLFCISLLQPSVIIKNPTNTVSISRYWFDLFSTGFVIDSTSSQITFSIMYAYIVLAVFLVSSVLVFIKNNTIKISCVTVQFVFFAILNYYKNTINNSLKNYPDLIVDTSGFNFTYVVTICIIVFSLLFIIFDLFLSNIDILKLFSQGNSKEDNFKKAI